ncbi:unnamed protein product [Sphagnum troendelagicum]
MRNDLGDLQWRVYEILHRILILRFPNYNAAIVTSIEEEGSQQGTTSASHVSGAEQTVPEVPVSSVKQADGDGPTSDDANENSSSGGEEIDQCPSLMRQLTSSDVEEQTVPPEAPIYGVEEAAGDSDDIMEYSSGVEEVARSCVLEWHFSLFDRECFLLHCWKVQDTGSGTSGVYRSPVRSLKELEEAGEECNSIHLISVDFVFPKLFHSDVPELEVTEELIELVMRINKDRVPLSLGRCWGVSIYFFSQCMVFQPAKVYEAGGGDGHR